MDNFFGINGNARHRFQNLATTKTSYRSLRTPASHRPWSIRLTGNFRSKSWKIAVKTCAASVRAPPTPEHRIAPSFQASQTTSSSSSDEGTRDLSSLSYRILLTKWTLSKNTLSVPQKIARRLTVLISAKHKWQAGNCWRTSLQIGLSYHSPLSPQLRTNSQPFLSKMG